MITRKWWDEMTPQQQWDHVQLLDAMVDDAEQNNHNTLRGGEYAEDEQDVLRRVVIDESMQHTGD